MKPQTFPVGQVYQNLDMLGVHLPISSQFRIDFGASILNDVISRKLIQGLRSFIIDPWPPTLGTFWN